MGRHTYTVLPEILESDEETLRLRQLYRVTAGEEVISEEEIIGYAGRLLAWRSLSTGVRPTLPATIRPLEVYANIRDLF